MKKLFISTILFLFVFVTYIKGQERVNLGVNSTCLNITNSNSALLHDFKIFPNPNNGDFTIQFTEEQQLTDIKITIYDLSGKVVKSFSKSLSDNTIEIKGIRPVIGVYFIQLKSQEIVQMRKLIIQ